MCGIVGGVSRVSPVASFLIQGLAALEYRGYDSVGIALQHGGEIQRFRTEGRVRELDAQVSPLELPALAGIGHTRWATHGVPSVRNAHPHVSECAEHHIAVVHNGIIENHENLRAELTTKGYTFTSDTDTEVIAHLVHWHLTRLGSLHSAVLAARKELHGLFAIAVLEASNPAVIYATRQGAPLLLGIAEDGHYLASDVSALLAKTNKVVYLEDGDIAVLTAATWLIESVGGSLLKRPVVLSELDATSIQLGTYQHYMQKEVFEQPDVMVDTLAQAASAGSLRGALFGPESAEAFGRIKQVLILACGTSYHSGLVMRHWIEGLVRIPCHVEVASEFRYRDPVVLPGTLVVVISQSGETADTRSALEYVQALGISDTLAICNVPESALTRLAKFKFLTRAGAEVGVASTKAFTTQLTAGYLLALTLAAIKGSLNDAELARRLVDLKDVPRIVAEALTTQDTLRRWARMIAPRTSAMFLGRGPLHAIALEGSLKLKEITYIHAEAYSAGELKHGPLALIDETMPVIVSVARDSLLDKVKANIEEVLARKGEVFVISDPECEITPRPHLHVLELPEAASTELSAIAHVIPLQLLSYHTALERGTDIDKPRNLAKSVTVE